MIQITDATSADLPAIVDLLNAEIRDGAALWTTRETDLRARAPWLAERQARFAIVVARSPDFAGFATYGPFRPHDGYGLTVEHSVYVAGPARGRGVARALIEALITRARAQGFHAMIGAIETGNAASRGVHARMGFREVGTLPQVGAKFGRWLDLTLVQLMLDERDAPGADPSDAS